MARKAAAKPQGLCGYLDTLIDELREKLATAFSQGDIESIHDARVATRRLSAALNLFEPQLSKKSSQRFKRSLKKIRRTLGPVRDLDVMLGHLRKLPKSKHDAIAFLTHSFNEQREEILAESRDVSTAKILSQLGNWWGIRDEIQHQDTKTLIRNSLSRQLDEFCIQADGQAVGGEVVLDHNPHELRIAGKALRYTLELASHDGLNVDPQILRTFKRMQDYLGLWHDYVVLSDNIIRSTIDQQLNYRNGKLARQLMRLGEIANRRAEKQLNGFVALWKKEGVELRLKIAAMIAPPIADPAPDPRPDSLSEIT